jgi:hypothetical protein
MDSDREQELEAQVQRLTRMVEEMRSRLVTLEGSAPARQGQPSRSSRRGFLRLGATAAAGAVGMIAAKAIPAAAADGNTLTIGSAANANNMGETTTTFKGDGAAASPPAQGAPVPVLEVVARDFNSTALNNALTPNDSFNAALQGLGAGSTLTADVNADGVDGWAGGKLAYGVYGLSDSGVGVTGEAITGIGLYARGTGRLKLDPWSLSTAGDPTSNYGPLGPDDFEQLRDKNGVLYIHGVLGGSGVGNSQWRRVNTLRVDTASGSNAPFKPLRLVDTRSGIGGPKGPFGNFAQKTYRVAGMGSGASAIPTDAVAVVGNLTATQFNSAGGYLSIHPNGVPYTFDVDPSSLNFSGSVGAWANSFVCGLDSSGKLTVSIRTYAGTTHFIIDITGYIQ